MTRRPRARLFFAALTTLVVGAAPVWGQSVRGFVTAAERGPLAGANVAVQRLDGSVPTGSLLGAVTDAQGFYEVTGVAADRVAVRATYVGYAAALDTLTVGGGPATWSPELVPAGDLDEVVVQAEGGAADVSGGLQRIRPADLARVPAPDVAGDLAVYLQSLPGVVSLGDRGGGLYVRGGTPSQNLVLVDGAPIYQPFHLVGFFSAFPEDLVSTVDFYAGGYGARYTGRVSSVLDVSIREGSSERLRAAGTAGPFIVSAQAEGPIRQGRSSWLVSARGSVVEQVSEALFGRALPLRFADVLAKASTSTPGSRCSATLVGTLDRGLVDAEAEDAFEWRNGVAAGQCVFAPPGSSGRAEVRASVSHLDSGAGPARDFRYAAAGAERESRLTETRFGAELQRPVSWGTLRYGGDASLYATRYRLGESFASVREEGDLILGAAAFVEGEVSLGAVVLTPGVAAVLQPYTFRAGLEPRFRATWTPAGRSGPEVALATGLYRQSLVGLVDERDAGSSFIAWAAPPDSLAETRALHAVLGGSVPLGGGLRVGAEAYAKRADDLPVPVWSARAEFTTRLTAARATSVGADVRAEWSSRRAHVYLAYGYGRTEYEATQSDFGILYDEPIQRYTPAHDRRHQVQASGQVEVGRFELVGRWQVGSGLPYTQPLGFDTVVPPLGLPIVTENPGIRRIVFERPFDGRLPAYHRLDLSASTEVPLDGLALDVQAGAINVYDRANILYYDLFAGQRVDQLPLVPYVSARLRTP